MCDIKLKIDAQISIRCQQINREENALGFTNMKIIKKTYESISKTKMTPQRIFKILNSSFEQGGKCNFDIVYRKSAKANMNLCTFPSTTIVVLCEYIES